MTDKEMANRRFYSEGQGIKWTPPKKEEKKENREAKTFKDIIKRSKPHGN